jgi:cytochrome P450 family 49 subfamily A
VIFDCFSPSFSRKTFCSLEGSLDENRELPGHFLHELYKWALECKSTPTTEKFLSSFVFFTLRWTSFRPGIAVCRVSLDTRLGCVSDSPNPESKKIIDAINTFFWTVAEVELRLPVWRFYKTKTFKDYIGALDSFRE